MRNETRMHVVPRTKAACYLTLLAGVLLLAGTTLRLREGVAVLPVVSVVLAVVVIGCAVVGLASPRLRGR